MYFLSVYRLKYLLSLGIVVTLLIGIALLYVLVYSFIISSVTIQVQSDFRTLLISIFLSTSMLMILSSLAGIYGLIRKKNKSVVFYAITMLFYLVSFLMLGVFTVNAPEFFETQCQSPTQSEYQLTIINGTSTLCKSDCECYYTNSFGHNQQTLKRMGILNYSLTNTSLPVNAQNCPYWSNSSFPLTSQLEIIEKFFNCSGWCYPVSMPPYYIFSNINGGAPQSYCAESISAFMQKFGHVILITSFTVFGFLCVILLIVICLCLHPDRGLKYDSLQLFKKVPVFIEEHFQQSLMTGK